MMRPSDKKLSLADGRTLGYLEYGDPKGFPVLAFHGLPGSRIWFEQDDEVSRSLGVRLIMIDRPGYGLSDYKKPTSFLEFGRDVQALTQSLALQEYSVFGISGGGVFAAAVAYLFPDEIYKCGLISTVNEFENGKPPEGMAAENRSVFTLARRFPWLLKFMLNQQKKLIEKQPDRYVTSVMSNTTHLCKADQLIMEKRENAEFLLIHMGEAFRKGVRATVHEARLHSKPWGFDPAAIQVPVAIFHGTADTLSPITPIRQLAATIPNCESHFLEGNGHFLTEEPDIWEGILTSLKPD